MCHGMLNNRFKKQPTKPIFESKSSDDEKDDPTKYGLNRIAPKQQKLEDVEAYAYDEVYESFKPPSTKRIAKDRDPKYIHGLMKAAEQRKLDHERAEQKKILRERQKEEEESGVKSEEKFVTGAYKEKMEELKRLEEEEKRREATQRQDMSGFYRSVLDMREHGHSVTSTSDKSNAETLIFREIEEEKKEQMKIASLAQKGIVMLNDSSEIVDKRQLLMPGLNVTKTQTGIPKATSSQNTYQKERTDLRVDEKKKKRLLAMRQELHDAKRHADEQEEKEVLKQKGELKKKMESKITESDVGDARQRYLARKKLKLLEAEPSDSD